MSHTKRSRKRKQVQATASVADDVENQTPNQQSTSDDTIDDYSIAIKKDKKSFVWKDFGSLFDGRTQSIADEGFNYCRICLTKLKSSLLDPTATQKSISQQLLNIQKYKSGTSTTNLLNHLTNTHKMKLEKHDASVSQGTKKMTEYFGVNGGEKKVTEIYGLIVESEEDYV
ncbi:hypothetical protein Bhyg_12063 [Pseudolycoriella hygida]|uniref:BED-type domain-containing protein n=1 Tax=Pseudolycoriella hygida TaxID=35572 RepID=A0A9Q0MY00_9DIPT|nr:hypothetical protein Bhyg_12063 [Pseudolycoriella hygida]